MTPDVWLTKGGVVVWILLALSILALAIVLERLLHFLRMGRPPHNLEQQLHHLQTEKNTTLKLPPVRGPEGAIIIALLNAQKEGVADLVRVATRVGSQELQRMERGLRALGMIGNIAPLLGLLGTIIGMIKAFMVIENAGGKVDAQALAGGIWEAMITTGVGLAVAIPVLFLLHWLESMAERRAHAMQHYASLLIEGVPHSSETPISDSLTHRGSFNNAV